MNYRFATTCVECPGSDAGDALRAMIDTARCITRGSFLRWVNRDDLRACESRLLYDTGTERGGLRMAQDWHVSYHRSVFRGRPCVYFVHSAIEWIFTEEP